MQCQIGKERSEKLGKISLGRTRRLFSGATRGRELGFCEVGKEEEDEEVEEKEYN